MRKSDTDWTLASRELVRAVRGRRSQRDFSARLGFSGRPVADWESGRRFPTAASFIKACQLARIDLAQAARRFDPASAPALAGLDDEAVAAWLRALRGRTPVQEVAARAGMSRFAVSRCLSGRNHPRLPQWLALIEATTDRAADWVAELVDIEKVPSLAPARRRTVAARELAFNEPWTAAVLRVIETEAYRALPAHVPGLLEETLGIDAETVSRCVARLERAEMIEVDPASGKLTAVPNTVVIRSDPEALLRLKTHWATVGAARVPTMADDDLCSFNLISASKDDLPRIRAILLEAFREIRSVVSVSPPEEVGLVCVQLSRFPVQASPEAASKQARESPPATSDGAEAE